jgi:competence protein ComEA
MTLPGIGESRAEAIIAYREEAGWISAPEELMNVSGIAEKMYEKIADLIEV